jgi:hypothetical protein
MRFAIGGRDIPRDLIGITPFWAGFSQIATRTTPAAMWSTRLQTEGAEAAERAVVGEEPAVMEADPAAEVEEPAVREAEPAVAAVEMGVEVEVERTLFRSRPPGFWDCLASRGWEWFSGGESGTMRGGVLLVSE